MDELRQFAETLEELVACHLEIKKRWASEAKAERKKVNKALERSWCLYRQCRENIYILPGLLFERFSTEEICSLWHEVWPKLNKFLSYYKEVINFSRYYFDITRNQDKEQLILTELKEFTSELFKAVEKGIAIEITPEVFLSTIPSEDSGKFDILVNLWQIHDIYIDLIGHLLVMQKDKRLTKPKLSRCLDNFAIELPDLAQKLGWPEISNQVHEIEIAIQKAKKRIRRESSQGTREYADGLIPLMNILQEFQCKSYLLIYRFSIDKRLKAEAFLSSFLYYMKEPTIDQFKYEVFTYRFSRRDIEPVEVIEAVYKLWHSDFQELDEGTGISKKNARREFPTDTWWNSYTHGEKDKIEFCNLVAMIRFAEWAEIGQFDIVFEKKLKKFENYFRVLPFHRPDMALWYLFLSCRSQFVVKHLRQAIAGSVEGMRIMHRDGLTPWSKSNNRGDEYYVEHCLLDACQYLFVTIMLEKFDKDEYLDSQAIKLILTEQNISGWWPYSTLPRFIPSLQTTALAIQTLSLLKPRGWKLAVLRGVNWLWSQQCQDGMWVERQPPRLFWPSPGVDWLTVLILDTFDLVDGKTKLTFKLPKTVAQTVIGAETGKQAEKEQQEVTKSIERKRGRPKRPDADEKTERIAKLKATDKYSWKEIATKVGMKTAAAARQLHYRHNKKNIKNSRK